MHKTLDELERSIDEQIAAHKRESVRPFSGSADSPIEALEKVKAKISELRGGV
jgi:hypothetical protein